jgi:D-arabinose 1-dehydrogenase-like Zn-dependent alcohol dehydrogenase
MSLAAVFTAPHKPIELRDIPKPKLEPGAAMLHTLYSEVCGTDVHLHHGKLDVPFPIIPGHDSVGVESETNGALKDVLGASTASHTAPMKPRSAAGRRTSG